MQLKQKGGGNNLHDDFNQVYSIPQSLKSTFTLKVRFAKSFIHYSFVFAIETIILQKN